MPRRLLGIFILLLEFVMQVQAQGDAVLLKVGSESVGVKEFEYFYRQSLNKDMHQFLQAFIDYKVKLQYAKELGLDTLKGYRLQASLPMAVASQSLEREREWIKLYHVTIPLKQYAGRKEEQAAKLKLDSLHAEWRNGGDWKQMSEEMPWIQTRFLLEEWQEQVHALYKDQVSVPFCSPIGVHLIAWADKRKARVESGNKGGEDERLLRQREMENGWLIAALAARESVTQIPAVSELEAFFDQHREKYGWKVPHFRGIVVHCKNKKEAKAIKKYLRKYPVELWKEAMERIPASVSGKCLYEVGLFRIGENAYVDKLAFKCGTFSPLAEYPYTWVLGDKLKEGPRSYRDVKEKVEKDCREQMEMTRMEQLRQKYKVEINEEVLKTVNNEGNN